MTLGRVLTWPVPAPRPLDDLIARGADLLARLRRWVRLRHASDGSMGGAHGSAPEPRPDDPDRELLREVLADYPHDTRAYSRLVQRHWRRVRTLCQGILVNPQDGEEAAQDAFLKAHRHLPSFRFDSRFATWLHRLAVNTALSLYAARRRRNRVIERVTREPPLLWLWRPRPAPDPARVRDDLRLALEALDPKDRAIVVLHVMEGVSYDELAEALELSPGAVRMRAMRAREKLRRLIGEFDLD